jgi:hypothetical protein
MSTCSKIWYDVLDSRKINIDLRDQKQLNQLLWDKLKQENSAEISNSLILNDAFLEFSERCADEYYEGKLINDEFLDFMIIENSFYFKEHLEFLNNVSLTLIRNNRKKIKDWLVEYELKNSRVADIRVIKKQKFSKEMLSTNFKYDFIQDQKQQQNSDRWFYFVIALILLGILSLFLFFFL